MYLILCQSSVVFNQDRNTIDYPKLKLKTQHRPPHNFKRAAFNHNNMPQGCQTTTNIHSWHWTTKEFTFSKVLKFFCGHEVLKLYFSGQKIHVFEILEHKNTCFLIRNLNFWSRIVILIFWRIHCSRLLRPCIKWRGQKKN